MTNDVAYDLHYREDPAACGAPFKEFEAFCGNSGSGSVLDLGCGQGRDALMFARAGHRVVGGDLSSVGIGQMREVAAAESLDVQGVVADVCTYRPAERFDIVVLDRVLHMLEADARTSVLQTAMDSVAPDGYLLVAEGPKGMVPVRAAVEAHRWALVKATRNRLFAQRVGS